MAGERLLVSPSCRLSGPRESTHLDGGDIGDAAPVRLAMETNHSRGNGSFPFPEGGWTRF